MHKSRTRRALILGAVLSFTAWCAGGPAIADADVSAGSSIVPAVDLTRSGDRQDDFAHAPENWRLSKANMLPVAPVVPDPLVANEQYYLDALRVSKSQGYGKGRVVALLDSGIDQSLPELKDTVVASYDFVANREQVSDDIGHGTRLATIIAARPDGVGISGVAPGAKLIDAKVFDASGKVTNERVARAIEFAVSRGATVVNLSFSGSRYSEAIESAIRRHTANGVTFVAAAGNDGLDGVSYPAAYRYVYSVGSLDRLSGEIAAYSNHGKGVDIYVPDGIWAYDRTGYRRASGTSEAAALVSGIIDPAWAQNGGVNEAGVSNLGEGQLASHSEGIDLIFQESEERSYLNAFTRYLATKEDVGALLQKFKDLNYDSIIDHSNNVLVDVLKLVIDSKSSNGDYDSNRDGSVVERFNAYIVLLDSFSMYARIAYGKEFDDAIAIDSGLWQKIGKIVEALKLLVDNWGVPAKAAGAMGALKDTVVGAIQDTKGRQDPLSILIRRIGNSTLDVLYGGTRKNRGISNYSSANQVADTNSYLLKLNKKNRDRLGDLLKAVELMKSIGEVIESINVLEDFADGLTVKVKEMQFLFAKAADYFWSISYLSEQDVYDKSQQDPLSANVFALARENLDAPGKRKTFFVGMVAYAAYDLLKDGKLGEVADAVAVQGKLVTKVKGFLSPITEKTKRIKTKITEIKDGAKQAVTVGSFLINTISEGFLRVGREALNESFSAYKYAIYNKMAAGMKGAALYDNNLQYLTGRSINARIFGTVIAHRYAFYSASYLKVFASSLVNNSSLGLTVHIVNQWKVDLAGARYVYKYQTWVDNAVTAAQNKSYGVGWLVAKLAIAIRNAVTDDRSEEQASNDSARGLEGYLSSIDQSDRRPADKLADFFTAYSTIATTLTNYESVLTGMAAVSETLDVISLENKSTNAGIVSILALAKFRDKALAAATEQHHIDPDSPRTLLVRVAARLEQEYGVHLLTEEQLLDLDGDVTRVEFFSMLGKVGLRASRGGLDNPYRDKGFIDSLRYSGEVDYPAGSDHKGKVEVFGDFDDEFRDGRTLSLNQRLWLHFLRYKGIVNGDKDNNISPFEPIIRQDALRVIAHLFLDAQGQTLEEYLVTHPDLIAQTQERMTALQIDTDEWRATESPLKSEIAILIAKGLLNGDCSQDANGTRVLALGRNLSRYEAGVLARRFMSKILGIYGSSEGNGYDDCPVGGASSAQQIDRQRLFSPDLAEVPTATSGDTKSLRLTTRIPAGEAPGYSIEWAADIGKLSNFQRTIADGVLDATIDYVAPVVTSPQMVPIDVFLQRYDGHSTRKTFYVLVEPQGHTDAPHAIDLGVALSAAYEPGSGLFQLNWQTAGGVGRVVVQESYDGYDWTDGEVFDIAGTSGQLSRAVEGSEGHSRVYFRGRAENASGSEHGPWSVTYQLDYVVDKTPLYVEKATEAPATPWLSALGDSVATNAVTLNWKRVNDSKRNDNALYYEVQHADNNGFFDAQTINAGNNLSTPGNIYSRVTYQVSGLENDQRHYFRVRAVNHVGSSPWSLPRSTVVKVNQFPAFVSSAFQPANGGLLADNLPVFSWDADDPNGDDLQFYLALGTAPDQLSSVMSFSSLTTNRKRFHWGDEGRPPLQPGKTYYWQVLVREEGADKARYGGSYIASPVMSFTTASNGPDLALQSATLLGEVSPGNKAQFRVVIRNVGNLQSEPVNYEVFYSKDSGTTEFVNGSNKVTTKALAPGESEEFIATVRFKTSTFTSSRGVFYDNVLQLGSSKVVFQLRPGDQDLSEGNDRFEVPIEYVDSGRPVFTSAYVRASSWYNEHSYLVRGHLGQVLKQICFVAEDDFVVEKATIEVQVSDGGAWELLATYQNDHDSISECLDWQVPNSNSYLSNAARIRFRAYDGPGTFSELITYPFPIYASELAARITRFEKSSNEIGAAVSMELEVDGSYPLEELSVRFMGGTEIYHQFDHLGIDLSGGINFEIPVDNDFVKNDAYLEVRLYDTVGNQATVSTGTFELLPRTQLEHPFGSLIPVFPEDPDDAELVAVEVDDIGIVHMVIRKRYSQPGAVGTSETRYYYRRYDSRTGTLGPSILITDQGPYNAPDGNLIAGVIAFDIALDADDVYVLASFPDGSLRVFYKGLAQSSFQHATITTKFFTSTSSGFFSAKGSLHAFWMTYPTRAFADQRLQYSALTAGQVGPVEQFLDEYSGSYNSISASHIYSVGKHEYRLLNANLQIIGQGSVADTTGREHGDFYSDNPAFIDFYLSDEGYYLLGADGSSTPFPMAEHNSSAIQWTPREVRVIGDTVVSIDPESDVGSGSGSFTRVSKWNLDTGKFEEWRVGDFYSNVNDFAKITAISANGVVVLGTVQKGPFIAVADLSDSAVLTEVRFAKESAQIPVNGMESIDLVIDQRSGAEPISRVTIFESVGGVETELVTLDGLFETRFDYTPAAGPLGPRSLRLLAVDDAGQSFEDRMEISVYQPAEITGFFTDRTSVAIGETVRFSWLANGVGGDTPFTVYRQAVNGADDWIKLFTVAGVLSHDYPVTHFAGSQLLKVESGASSLVAANLLSVTGELFEFDENLFSPSGFFQRQGDIVSLSWVPKVSSDNVVYQVYAKLPGEADFRWLGSTSRTEMTFNTAGNDHFEWKVAALTGTQVTESPIVSAGVLIPAVPVIESAAVAPLGDGELSIVLAIDITDPDAVLAVYREQGGEFLEIGYAVDGAFTDQDVLAGNSYRYQARSQIGPALSEPSETVTVSAPFDDPYEVEIVNPPNALVDSASLGIQVQPVTVAVAPASVPLERSTVQAQGPEFESYQVLSGTDPRQLTEVGIFPGREFDIEGLVAGTTYYVEVYGLGASGARVSAIPAVLSFTTAFDEQPLVDAPSLSITGVSVSRIDLEWTEVTGAQEYRVCRRQDNEAMQCLFTTTELFVQDGAELQPGAEYSYQVRAGNSLGETLSQIVTVKLPLDTDGDGFDDAVDNCPLLANADQANNDGDAQGDACDPDDDNDTLDDSLDPFPKDPDLPGKAGRIRLYPGMNLFAYMAVAPADHQDCFSLYQSLGGADTLRSIAYLNKSTFKVEACNAGGGSNFPITAGEAYFADVYAEHELILSTRPECRPIELQSGPNLRGFPEPPTGYSCFQWLQDVGPGLFRSIQRFDQVSKRFQSCAFDTTPVPVGVDFLVVPGEGYLLHAKAGGSYNPPGCGP